MESRVLAWWGVDFVLAAKPVKAGGPSATHAARGTLMRIASGMCQMAAVRGECQALLCLGPSANAPVHDLHRTPAQHKRWPHHHLRKQLRLLHDMPPDSLHCQAHEFDYAHKCGVGRSSTQPTRAGTRCLAAWPAHNFAHNVMQLEHLLMPSPACPAHQCNAMHGKAQLCHLSTPCSSVTTRYTFSASIASSKP